MARGARSGEAVVVWLKDRCETRIARYYPEGAFIRLQPLNPLMPPAYEPRENVVVQAAVVAMLRAS